MLYFLAQYAQEYCSVFHVIHYVSFRAIGGLLTALICSFIWGNRFIAKAKQLFRSKARELTPESHRAKDNMPTMGGLFILCVFVANVLLWCNLQQPNVWIFLCGVVGFGAIGFFDDWSKIYYKKGISARTKFILQWGISLITMALLLNTGFSTTITFPFIKWFQPALGMFFLLWGAFLMTATSNAVNLTDGLDGLAIVSLIPNFAFFTGVSYLAGHYQLAHYLNIPFAGSAELAVIGAILVGASIGFLWYNAYPAQIFMGDVGSLALGSALALLALLSKQELLLAISGGLFVAETLSVIAQVWSFRYLGKRIFRMAPMHHHFELLGWQEAKITIRFGIISLILCLLAAITLKLR
ncbi:MAG: phospho-N-acetylmuramoyl-pentapeptide-transferase [Candidatus Babeliales bacterium]